jgi:uncharacterized protein (TIGR03067 family)
VWHLRSRHRAAKSEESEVAALKQLSGEWVLSWAEIGGKQAREKSVAGLIRLRVQGKTLTWIVGKGETKYRLRIAPETRPREIDLTFRSDSPEDDFGTPTEVTCQGIYALSENTLTLCVSCRDEITGLRNLPPGGSPHSERQKSFYFVSIAQSNEPTIIRSHCRRPIACRPGE